MLGSSIVPLPCKKYTATCRFAVPLPYKSFGFKSRSSAFTHRLSTVPLPHKEYTLTWNICNCRTKKPLVKHFSCYIFWSACLVFWSKQAKYILKIMEILLLMTQFYNAHSKFATLTVGDGRWPLEPTTWFRKFVSQNRTDNDGKKYRLEDFCDILLFACVREDDHNRHSWSHEMRF